MSPTEAFYVHATEGVGGSESSSYPQCMYTVVQWQTDAQHQIQNINYEEMNYAIEFPLFFHRFHSLSLPLVEYDKLVQWFNSSSDDFKLNYISINRNLAWMEKKC